MIEDGKIVRPDGDVSRRVNWTVADGKSAWVQIGAETRDATPMAREFLRAISLYGGGWRIYRDALSWKTTGPQGASDNEHRWSDYRNVDGRQFAFSTVVYRDGVKYMESTIQHLDPKLDDALFTMSRSTAAGSASR
jgi:hypothetical protein